MLVRRLLPIGQGSSPWLTRCSPSAVRNDQKVIAAYLGVAADEVEAAEAEVGL